tara:strand:+ start:653 stop:1519 length:867 start_codon:yes stop_codon:yes gene_type:complete
MGDKKDDKIIEFSAYKQNKTLVQELVDEDKKANEFFEKSFPNSNVKYVDRIENILNKSEKNFVSKKPIIIATTIILRDPQHRVTRQSTNQTHSILLIWDGDTTIYFYDPNGSYTLKGEGSEDYSLGFTLKLGDTYENFDSTEDLRKKLHEKTKKTIKIPAGKGIQYMDMTAAKSNYINAGGYCMFYNWLVIEYFYKKPVNTWSEVYNQVIDPNSSFWNEIMNGKKKIDQRSKEIIDHWVAQRGGRSTRRKRRRSTRRKRRRSTRRKRGRSKRRKRRRSTRRKRRRTRK